MDELLISKSVLPSEIESENSRIQEFQLFHTLPEIVDGCFCLYFKCRSFKTSYSHLGFCVFTRKVAMRCGSQHFPLGRTGYSEPCSCWQQGYLHLLQRESWPPWSRSLLGTHSTKCLKDGQLTVWTAFRKTRCTVRMLRTVNKDTCVFPS